MRMLALVAFRWSGCGRSPRADAMVAPLAARAEGGSQHRDRGRQRRGSEAWSRPPVRPGTSGGETAFPATLGSERIGNTAQTPGKEAGPLANRKQLIENWSANGRQDLTGLWGVYGISRETGHNRVQRFPDRGNPIGFGGYSAVTHRICPALLRPLSTAQIINPVADRPPLSAQRPAHPEVLAPQGPSANPPSRPAEDVR